MTTFHWVRHGPTHAKTFVGWTDLPADLSDHAQIARLNAYLPDDAVVVASDLRRASATADTLAPRTRLPDDPRLREFNFGVWDNKGFEEVSTAYPDLSRTYWEEPGDVAPPDGESWNQAAARAHTAVGALCARYPDGAIIAVAHFGIILTQLQRATGKSPYEVLAQKVDNLSVTTLTVTDGRWEVGAINHLP